MSVVVISGSAGLIGSEAAEFYLTKGYHVVGIDNNLRRYFFGEEGSTEWRSRNLRDRYSSKYLHLKTDIRDAKGINRILARYKNNISLILHAAAQPSHDWAAREPVTDFTVNANGTLYLLEAMRQHCPDAVFIFMSTNKVYGEHPNHLPLVELETRWEIDSSHAYSEGIPETMSVDQCLHSLFGTSKLAADLLVQEYGRYYHLKTCCFRGGVLTGASQSGTSLHGFINYLMKCTMTGTPYTILGLKGKQVRDVIDSRDVISAINFFFENPMPGGQVYNLGGGKMSNISILEAIELAQKITGKKLAYRYQENPRKGDHIWYISDVSKFCSHYPGWELTRSVPSAMQEIYERNKNSWEV